MKRVLLILMLAIVSIGAVSAAEKADTIAVNNSYITKVIEDKTVNSKGKTVTKYYFLYNNELISTSKTVIEKYNLCKKYNARLAMVIVKKRNNKRIILN